MLVNKDYMLIMRGGKRMVKDDLDLSIEETFKTVDRINKLAKACIELLGPLYLKKKHKH